MTAQSEYVSPADPTLSPLNTGFSSYAANAQVFVGIPNLAHVFGDGASNTITFAEHYAFPRRQVQFDFLHGYESMYFESLRVTLRRAAFADYHRSDGPYNPAFHDVYPITTGPPMATTGSIPGLAFQVRPRIEECDTRIAQSPHSSGMLTAFVDASVRTLRGGMILGSTGRSSPPREVKASASRIEQRPTREAAKAGSFGSFSGLKSPSTQPLLVATVTFFFPAPTPGLAGKGAWRDHSMVIEHSKGEVVAWRSCKSRI